MVGDGGTVRAVVAFVQRRVRGAGLIRGLVFTAGASPYAPVMGRGGRIDDALFAPGREAGRYVLSYRPYKRRPSILG